MDNSNPVDSKLLSATLDGSVESCIPNGCVAVNKTVELTDEGDEAERVGVLDYMPSYKHRPSDVRCTDVASRIDLPLLRSQNSGSFIKAAEATPRCSDIELKTFSITESGVNLLGKPCPSLRAARRTAPLSCLSDDDELLVPADADNEDNDLQEVVVQSEQTTCARAPLSHAAAVSPDGRGGTQRMGRPAAAAGREVTTSFPYIPSSSFSIMRDAAWSNPDTACTSPINSPEPTGTTPVASKSNASASSHSSGCESVVGQRFGQQGQSSSRDQSPVGELSKDSEVHLAGDNLQPVEMLSVDRSQVDPSSLSQQNVVFFKDYFWPPTHALYRDDSGAAGERSEVKKRQERRDKRKKIHSLPVALAKDVAGYVGEGKTIEELMDYITKADNKDGTLKRKTSQDGHSQDDTKKPYGPTRSSKQAQVMEAKSESNKASEVTKFCDVTFSVDGSDSPDSVDGTAMTLPGNYSSRIFVLSGSDSPAKNNVSQDVGGTANVSEDAKRKRKRKPHKALQHREDSETGEDLSGKLTTIFAQISLGAPGEFGAKFCTAEDVKDAKMDAVGSSLLYNLVDGTATTTDVQVSAERVTVHDRSSKHAKRSTEVKEDIVKVQSPIEIRQLGEEAISTILSESLPLDSAASTLALSPTNDRPSHPSVTAIPSSGAASHSEPNEGVSLSEESGQWQEFQSKKKRARNAVPQSVDRNPAPTLQKPSAGAVPSAPQKKTAPEAVSMATVHASAAVRGVVDASHGHKFPVATGYFPRVVRQGRYHGNIQSAGDVNAGDKPFHCVDFTAANPIESSNKLQQGDDFQTSNNPSEADFDAGRSLEGATYARMIAKDSSGLSCGGPQTCPSTGSLSSFGQQSEAASDETSDDKVTYCKDKVKTKRSSNADRLTEPLWDRHKAGTAEKSQSDKTCDNVVAKGKKVEATDEMSDSKPSANLSKGSRILDAPARPAVVFCKKGDKQFSEQSCGLSFGYSDDLVSGHLSSDVTTRPVADAIISSGCFHQASKSCEAASSTSGGINCGRPIAPLTGTGHASLARAPVLVVMPLPKVSQEEEPASRIVDADPQTLKEATIVATSACRSANAEAKEPASRMLVASLLTRPSLPQNLSEHGEPGLADDGRVDAASRSLQTEIGEHESVQNRTSSSPTSLKAVLERKTHRERNSNRHTTALHSSKKTFVFNVLEAAQYLTVDWEDLLIDDFAVYYSPDEQ